MEAHKEKLLQLWDEAERALHARAAAYNADPASMWIEPFCIYGRLYYVGDKVVCAHLLDTGEGLILFDSGYPHASAQIMKSIAVLGFKPDDIKFVIHSHEHFDHFGATRMLQLRYGCKTFIHESGADIFRIRPHHTEIQSANCPDATLFIPDVELSDGDVVRLGVAHITCVHTPGHSFGSATFFFDIEENGRLLHVGLCGVNGLLPLHPGRLLKYGIPLSAGDDYLASIGKLRDRSVDITLDTHPRPKGVIDKRMAMLGDPGSNPFVDPGFWNRNLDDYRSRYLGFMADLETQLQDR